MFINGKEYESLRAFVIENKFNCKNCKYKYYNDYRKQDYCGLSLDPCINTVDRHDPMMCIDYCTIDGIGTTTFKPEYTDFTDDEEKMRDFYELSKEEFLFSYSYLTEEEYDLNAEIVDQKGKINNEN